MEKDDTTLSVEELIRQNKLLEAKLKAAIEKNAELADQCRAKFSSRISPRPIEPEKYRTLYVWGIPKEATTEDVINYFNCYGQVDYCEVEETENHPTNHGTLKYHSIVEVDRVMSTKPHSIRDVDIKLRRVSREHPRTDRIAVKGLKIEHTVEALEQYFAQFGNILKTKFIPCVVCELEFEDEDGVDKLSLYHTHLIRSSTVTIERLEESDLSKKAHLLSMIPKRTIAGNPAVPVAPLLASIPVGPRTFQAGAPGGGLFPPDYRYSMMMMPPSHLRKHGL